MKILAGLVVFLILIVLAITGRLGGGFAFRFLLYLDMFGCALFLGDADMTISSRCGLALRAGGKPAIWAGLGRVLNLLVTNHCERAIADDLARLKVAQGRLTNADP